MADDSEFILRWEIDSTPTLLSTKTAHSEVFKRAGFEWIMKIEPSRLRVAENVILNCEVSSAEKWSCEADADFIIYHPSIPHSKKEQLNFKETERNHTNAGQVDIAGLFNPINGYLINRKVVFEFHIKIIRAEGNEVTDSPPIVDLTKFCSPNETGNVSLVFGDKKLQVSKEYLAIHSPVFRTMFYGKFDENGKDEVEIKEVEYEEFVDFLLVIFPKRLKIKDSTVVHLLMLGDRFQIEQVVQDAEEHLLQSNKFTNVEKLKLSDQFRLVKLRTHYLQKYNSPKEMKFLKSTPEYATFSDNMKAAMLDRVLDLA